MNLTVRLGKLFYESSIGVPALLPCSQLPRQARGTLIEIVYLTSLSGSFCWVVKEGARGPDIWIGGAGGILVLPTNEINLEF